jgi:hypothetical protein
MAKNTVPASTAGKSQKSQQQIVPAPDLKAARSKMIDPGHHVGKIVRHEFARRGDQQFTYLDLYIDVEGVELKVGYAANKVTDRSQLGMLLARLGWDPVDHEGEAPDWDEILEPGTEVQFDAEQETKMIEGREAKFARIKPDSVSPA